jgi:glycosyltransferase involved in cell wall biosynthesis
MQISPYASPVEHVPLFSVIIPVWNRQDTIRRCLDSVLAQDFRDYEIIVVDDGSTDGSPEVVAEYRDDRIRLVRHRENRGSYAARATGAGHASGQWIIVLGSDDALLDGALAKFSALAAAATDDTGIVGMSVRFDDGTTGPKPPFPPGDIGLTEWLTWCNTAERVDFLTAFRRKVIQEIPFPTDGRGSVQMMMRIAARWKIRVDPDFGVMAYTDAPNRLGLHKTSLLPAPSLRAHAIATEEVLQEFGPQLRDHAPRLHRKLRYDVGWWYLLAGLRIPGARGMLRYLARHPLDLRSWAWLAIGLAGPRAIHWVRNRRQPKRTTQPRS